MPTSKLSTRKRARRAKESLASYKTRSNTRRWKIPAITPVGSDAPVSETLPRAVERIATALHPEKIILFGSYAYGKPTPDSDVDLLVVLGTNQSWKERYLAVARLLRPRVFPLDLLVKTPEEIDYGVAHRDFFVQEILSRGKVLYGDDLEYADEVTLTRALEGRREV